MIAAPGFINDGSLVHIQFSIPSDSTEIFIAIFLILGNSEQELDIAAFKLTKTYALITFTRPVDLYKCSISLNATTKFDTNKWQPINAQQYLKYYSVWKLEDSFELNNEGDSILDLMFVDENNNAHSLQIAKRQDGLFGIKMPRFGYEFGSGVLSVLQDQLNSCLELLEYEPESKCKSINLDCFTMKLKHIDFFAGTLLTAALLMRATDRRKNHSKSLEFLDKLKQYDSNRTGYYTDLANKWNVEHHLANWITSVKNDRDTPIDLSNLNLVNIHYKQYLCVADQINLTANQFNGERYNDISTFLSGCNVKFALDKTSDP